MEPQLADGDPSLPEEVRTAAANPRHDLGDYVLVRRLGRGGMGEVWKAWGRQLRRFVAIKFIHGASDEDRERLLREARVAAQLDHPGIVPVYEARAFEHGPCIVMKYVEGETLDRASLTVRQKLMAVRDAALAIEHAHGQGVVHRDIKPQNIMVESSVRPPSSVFGNPAIKPPSTEPGRVLVMDFGLAKQHAVATSLSVSGVLVGTPLYMSPEQALGESKEIDARSDVYSLGATLYELVSGVAPFQDDEIVALLTRVVQEEPRPPSRFQPHLPADVDTIALKCLEKQKARRYASARDLAQDIQRHLDGEPILARRASAWHRVVKWARRRPAVAALAVVTAAAAVSLIGGAVWYNARLSAALALAEQRRQEAEAQSAEAQRLRKAAQVALAESLTAQGDAFGAAGQWERARLCYEKAGPLFEQEGASSLPAELGVWEALTRAPPPLVTFKGHQGAVTRALFLPDGERILSVGHDRTCRLWHTRTGRLLRAYKGHVGAIVDVALTPDGRRFLSVSCDRTARLWDLETGREIWRVPACTHNSQVAAISPDGGLAAIGCCGDEALRVLDVETGGRVRAIKATPSLHCLAFTPDGRAIACGGPGRTAELWDIETGRSILASPRHGSELGCIALSPDGRRLLTGGLDARMVMVDSTTDEVLGVFRGHSAQVTGVEFSRDGRTIVSASRDNTVMLWDAASRTVLRTFTFADTMQSVALSPDGRLVLAAGNGGAFHLCDLASPGEVRLATIGWSQAVVFAPDGRTATVACADGTLRLVDLDARQELRRTNAHAGYALGVAVSPDGKHILSTGADGGVKLWDFETGRLLRTFVGHAGAVFGAAFLPTDPRMALTTGVDRLVRAWDVETGREVHVFQGHEGNVYSIAFSPDGSRAITPGDNELVARVWDVVSRRELARLSTTGTNLCAVFAPNGRHAVVGSMGDVLLVDIETDKPVRRYLGHHNFVRRVLFTPDGRSLISTAADRTLKVWDFERAALHRSFVADSADVGATAFSPRANVLVSAGKDGLRVWDFELPARYRQFEAALERARDADPQDAAALAAFGEWYAFRNMPHWAAVFLEEARARGARVSSVLLAQCCWRAGDFAGARREFERAQAEGEPSAAYVRICLDVLKSR